VRQRLLQILLGAILFVLSVRFTVRDYGSTSLDATVVLRLAVIAVAVVVCLARPGALLRSFSRPAAALWLVLFVWLTLGGIYSRAPVVTAVSGALLVACLVVAVSAATELPAGSLVAAVLSSITVMLIVCLVAYVLYPDVARMNEWDPESGTHEISGRMQGVLGAPNAVGRVAGLYLVFAVAYRTAFEGRAQRALLILGGLLAVLSIVLSGSRTSLLSATFAIAVIFFLQRKARWAVPLIASVFLLGLLLLVPFGAVVLDRLSRHNTGDVLSGRGVVWSYAIELIRTHWLLGAGYNTTDIYFPEMARAAGRYFMPAHSHNFYLQMWACGGIIALVLGLAAILTTLGTLLQQQNRRVLTLFLFWFLSTFTETGGFDSVPTTATFGLLLPVALLVGVRKTAVLQRATGSAAVLQGSGGRAVAG